MMCTKVETYTKLLETKIFLNINMIFSGKNYKQILEKIIEFIKKVIINVACLLFGLFKRTLLDRRTDIRTEFVIVHVE